jgi:RNA polymerase sigma-70 factor (ECF subfamily)
LAERDDFVQRSDAELIAAACQGDLASFRALYERYYRLAVGIARSRLFDGHLAEDAAQEAFAVAFQSLSTLQDRDRFPQWLGTLCRRIASRMAKEHPLHEPLSEDRELTCDAGLAVTRQRVREAIADLDETSREIILLHYFSRQSYDEIARVTNLSIQAVHGRLKRARQKLAQFLETHNPTGTIE